MSDRNRIHVRRALPALVFPLFALCDLGAAARAFPSLASGELTEQVEHYAISGQSGAELYGSIGDNGPEIAGGRRTIAHTAFRLTWRRDYRPQADGRCVLASAVPRLVITYTLPRPRGELPAPVAASWKRFYEGLAAHEKVHGAQFIDMVNKISEISVGLSAEQDAGCQKVRAKLQRHLKQLSDERQALSRAYDVEEMSRGGNVHGLILGLVNGP